jgi:transcriptional regulator with XRE-family HTH domain
MKKFFKRKASETISEEAQLREIDERHFLSQQIFLRRDESNWSQEELARQAGLTQSQVASLEAGQSNPTLRTLSKLATAFGCSVSELFLNLEPDGCTAEDRAAAEALQTASSPLYSWDDPRWEEEQQATEFILIEGLHPMPSSGQDAFHAFLMKHTLLRNQQGVSVSASDDPGLDLREYDDATTEL